MRNNRNNFHLRIINFHSVATDKLFKYDLEERTAKFAENMIDLVRPIKQDAVNRRIIDQLVGCSVQLGLIILKQ